MPEKQHEESAQHPAPRQSFFSGMAPKASFVFGLLSGIAAMSLIGFVVTATLVASGKGTNDKGSTGTVAGDTVVQPPANPLDDAADPGGNPSALRAVSAADHSIGAENAKVTLIQFSDFQCPYCQRVHPTVKQILDEYDGKVRVIFRHFPLESIHPNARPAANASECIASLGGDDAFWKFADEAFANQSSLSNDFYTQTAKKVGVNEKKFQECYDAKKLDTNIQKDIDEGAAAGVQGTPATFINDQLISGALPYESFKAVIDQLLNS